MGLRPARRPGRTALAILCLAASWPGAAHGAARMGASSSSTVEIRLSVAPRMQLSAVRVSSSNDRGYCIKSNAGAPGLPVYLVWSDIEPSTPGPAARPEAPVELSWCHGERGAAGATRDDGTPMQALIRPE